MKKYLETYLRKVIRQEYVSVHHDYDTAETTYIIPYNASLASPKIKLLLLQSAGIIEDDETIDDYTTSEIEETSKNLIDITTPEFEISTSHYINNRGVLMTHYILDFDGDVLFQKSYPSNKLSTKNQMLRLIKLCSNKIIDQERAAQKFKMEKMLISTNMFNLRVTRDKR